VTAARLISRQVGSTTAAVAAEAGLDVGDGPDAFRARSAFVGQPDPSALDVVARLVEASPVHATAHSWRHHSPGTPTASVVFWNA
jgi:hypothetical protein